MRLKRDVLAALVAVLIWPSMGMAQASHSSTNETVAQSGFDPVADAALTAMRARAEELKISGVAVVAYFEGETIQAWSSKMIVVGKYKVEPTENNKGSNLLGIVYAKAAEMADTHIDSGSKMRSPMTGEFGWNGGMIARSKAGYVIAAFSGGKSEDDVEVSRAGLAKLKAGL